MQFIELLLRPSYIEVFYINNLTCKKLSLVCNNTTIYSNSQNEREYDGEMLNLLDNERGTQSEERDVCIFKLCSCVK